MPNNLFERFDDRELAALRSALSREVIARKLDLSKLALMCEEWKVASERLLTADLLFARARAEVARRGDQRRAVERVEKEFFE